MAIESIDPSTGTKLKTYIEMSQKDVKNVLEDVGLAFRKWRKNSFAQRAKCFSKAAQILRRNKKRYANIMAKEMGKPLNQGIAEVEKCAWGCEYYLKNAKEFLKEQVIKTEANKSFVTFQPLGVILAVMPWNFPFWQVFRAAAPALMAGNAMVLKHSSNVSQCSLEIENVFKKAGFPQNVFRTLIISSKHVVEVINHPVVQGVTLTGSNQAGAEVAAAAGKRIKKVVLELGGSDAYIVLEDADLALAAKICVDSRMVNSGQSCIAAKRFIVEKSIMKEFEKLFIKEMSRYKLTNPLTKNCNLGPLARKDLRDELHKQVTKSVAGGAKIVIGGNIPKGPGAFYEPTILKRVKPGMPAYEEELFGPVASLIEAKNEADAIRIANDNKYGLGAAIFTKNVKKAHRIATEQIESGSCFVNSFVKSDPRLPFGGIKQSGHGRELGSFGIKEFVNIKAVWIN